MTIISLRPLFLVLNFKVQIIKYNRIAKNEDSVLGGRKERKVIKVDDEGSLPTEMVILDLC